MSYSIEDVENTFSNSPIGVYIIRDKKFSYVNEVFINISGYEKEELIQMNSMDILFPEDREKVKKAAVRMLKKERTAPYEFRIKTRSGSIRWIMESVASIRFDGQRATLGYFMDITHTKQMEKALQESEQKYRSIFELAREGIIIADYQSGAVLDANAEFQRQTGYGLDMLKKKKLWDLQPEEFRKEARSSFFRFKENRGGLTSWNLCQNREGRMLPVEIVAQHMVIDGRDVAICMVRDTSEREAMIRALTLASEEWRRSFDALNDVVMLITPDFKVSRANMATARLLKLDIGQVINRNCYELFHNTDKPPAYCPLLRAKSQGIYFETEAHEEHLDRILRFCASPIKDETGKITHAVEVISDVTKSRQDEIQSVRLSRVLADSFKGITQALSDLVESRDPYTAGHSDHVARIACKAGKELGLDPEELEGLRICATLHDIGKAIIPAAILNKPGKLSEHEWGLIKEHPKYAYETLKRIPFPWPVADVVCQHHERLDGMGYPLGLREDKIHFWAKIIAVADIFDAMTSHRPYRPGLPFREAVEELNNGKGVKYDGRVVEVVTRLLSLDDSRVMVVDYDPEVIRGICGQLEMAGLTPVGHTTSAAALDAFEEKAFPVVITELDMPKLDGAQLTDRIKEMSPDTEVIIISKYGSKDGSLRALRSGASDFFEKPINMELFNKSLNRALQRFSSRKSKSG